MNAVILACTTLADYVRAAQQACSTDYPVVLLDRNYHVEPTKMREHILATIGKLTNSQTDDNNIRQVIGVPFSQYVRLNTEYKHYFYLGRKSTFVTRLLAGIGFPYGNSKAMPYEKSFFGGGPTTIRAWHLRHLGPGNYQSDSDNMLERIGDGSSRIAVPTGLSAVSVSSDDVLAVGGAITAGSFVDVYVESGGKVVLLGEDILVLETSTKEQAQDAKITWVTLAVTPQSVSDLLSAAAKGAIHLVLPGKDEAPQTNEGANNG